MMLPQLLDASTRRGVAIDRALSGWARCFPLPMKLAESPLWWLLGVLVVWANLHASFVTWLGVAAAGGADAVALS